MGCRAVAVLLAAVLGWPAGADEARVREIVLGSAGDVEAALTLARALGARLDAAGIEGTVRADPPCTRLRVQLDARADPDGVRALLSRPFGPLEFRRILGAPVSEADCAAARAAVPGGERSCIAEPGGYPGDIPEHYLTELAFAVPQPEVSLGGDPYTGMPQLVLTLGADEAGALCELTRDAVGLQVALVVDGSALSVPHIVEPICGGTLALSGNQPGEEGMRGLEAIAARIAATMLPPPVIEREAVLAKGAALAPLCADGAPGRQQP